MTMAAGEQSMFKNAAGVSLYNSNLTNAHTINNVYHDKHAVMRTFKENVAFGALYNSAERFGPPKCHPETRTAVLDSIERWARSNDDSKPVLWLRGPAGAGKSAIAQTLAERWGKLERILLAASFFFSRTVAGRNEKTYLIATIAYQLAKSFPLLRSHIEKAIAEDSGIFQMNLSTQLTELVVRPLAGMIASASEEIRPKVIIIDGLDECQGEDAQREILEAISSLLHSFPSIPLRFLIASRPELQLRESFKRSPLDSLTAFIILDDSFNPDADIELFLRCKFEEMRELNPFLDPSWPSDELIASLVEKSSGQFIYPSTAIRYIGTPRASPERNLTAILDIESSAETSEQPLAELDALYAHILRTVSPSSQQIAFDVLGFLVCDKGSLDPPFPTAQAKKSSPEFFTRLFFLQPGEIYMHLTDLHSIIELPSIEDSNTEIRLVHASFSEYLTRTSRAGPYAVDIPSLSLRIYTNLMKHLIITLSQPRSGCRAYALACEVAFASWPRQWYERGDIPLCPPSKVMKLGFEAAMSRRNNKSHRAYLQSVGLSDMGPDRVHHFPALLVQRLHGHEKLAWVYEYLQKCNNKEIEPWLIRRIFSGMRLKTLIGWHRFLSMTPFDKQHSTMGEEMRWAND